jgi:hypothetical protein
MTRLDALRAEAWEALRASRTDTGDGEGERQFPAIVEVDAEFVLAMIEAIEAADAALRGPLYVGRSASYDAARILRQRFDGRRCCGRSHLSSATSAKLEET